MNRDRFTLQCCINTVHVSPHILPVRLGLHCSAHIITTHVLRVLAAGREGKAVTGRIIGERLAAESETSVCLHVTPVAGVTELGARVTE